MKKLMHTLSVLFVICLALATYSLVSVEAAVPKAELPVLLTSAGQCPQIDVLAMFFDLAGVKYDFYRMPNVAVISAGVGFGGDPEGRVDTDLDIFAEGTPYQTVFITMGASMKAMGAAGIDADEENKRVEATTRWMKEQGVFIIGAHFAGEDRRYHHLSEGVIDRVTPHCDLLLVSKASNEDGRFTAISKELDIPMILVDTEFDIVDVLIEMFKDEK